MAASFGPRRWRHGGDPAGLVAAGAGRADGGGVGRLYRGPAPGDEPQPADRRPAHGDPAGADRPGAGGDVSLLVHGDRAGPHRDHRPRPLVSAPVRHPAAGDVARQHHDRRGPGDGSPHRQRLAPAGGDREPSDARPALAGGDRGHSPRGDAQRPDADDQRHGRRRGGQPAGDDDRPDPGRHRPGAGGEISDPDHVRDHLGHRLRHPGGGGRGQPAALRRPRAAAPRPPGGTAAMSPVLSLLSLLRRLAADRLLLVLLVAFPLLWLANPEGPSALVARVHWPTIAALAELMLLSRLLEESGYLARWGRALLERVHGERRLAAALILFSALLSAVVTNDVALFVVVPLILGLDAVARLPIGRLIVFQALAVNAGSTRRPVGTPQHLSLWQAYEVGFGEFLLAMLPLGAGLTLLLLALVPLAFPARRIEVHEAIAMPPARPRLMWLALAGYPLFLWLADGGQALPAALAVGGLCLLLAWRVLLGVDWALLLVFVLMFIDLGLLGEWAWMQRLLATVPAWPGGLLTGGAAISQLVSNVPATLLLAEVAGEWRPLAWGVSVGGFGLAIGSLANLIALRLGKRPGLWGEFHRWSLPMLALSLLLAFALERLMGA